MFSYFKDNLQCFKVSYNSLKPSAAHHSMSAGFICNYKPDTSNSPSNSGVVQRAFSSDSDILSPASQFTYKVIS